MVLVIWFGNKQLDHNKINGTIVVNITNMSIVKVMIMSKPQTLDLNNKGPMDIKIRALTIK